MSNSSTSEHQQDFRATLLRRASRMPNDWHKQPRSSLSGDFMSTSNTISKIGAVFYIIWACLHLLAAYSVYVLGRSLDSSMVQGRLFQDAWNLLFFCIIGISVAATLNWRNSVWGYWDQLRHCRHRGYRLYLLRPCPRLCARLA